MAGIITTTSFFAWKEAQSLRNSKVGNQADVDLSNEPESAYFYVSTLQTILNSKPDSIVFRFGCSDIKTKFNNLEVAIQARDASDNPTVTFLSHKVLGSGVDDKDPADWTDCENNFKERNKVINAQAYSAQFADERGGIRHTVQEFSDWLSKLTAGEVAAHFIYDGDKTSVALVDSSFTSVGALAAAAIAPPSIFDQGNKCCP